MPERGTLDAAPQRRSAQLDGWLRAEPDPTLGELVAFFGHKSFAIAFVLLLGVPALPLPTGGTTHVLELTAILLTLSSSPAPGDLAAAAVGPRRLRSGARH